MKAQNQFVSHQDATFDPDIAYKVGKTIANEARSKGLNCILGRNACTQRHPTGERNFETFGEDPFLSGKLAAQVIRGLQDCGIGAAIKSFVANEESNVDASISERALRDIYLRPFEIALKEASPLALMMGSNALNETPCYESGMLYDFLRKWNWEGLIMGDCAGAHSVSDALKAGGTSHGRDNGDVIDDRFRAVLHFITKVHALSKASGPHISSETEDRAFIRKAGAQGIVLLKNEGSILPLETEKLNGKKIAIIGLAQHALVHGLQDDLGGSVEFLYAKGFHKSVHRSVPLRNIAYFHEADRERVLDEAKYLSYLGNSASEILQTGPRSLSGRRYGRD